MQPGASATQGGPLVPLHLYAALVDQPFKPSHTMGIESIHHHSSSLMLRHKKSIPRKQNRLGTWSVRTCASAFSYLSIFAVLVLLVCNSSLGMSQPDVYEFVAIETVFTLDLLSFSVYERSWWHSRNMGSTNAKLNIVNFIHQPKNSLMAICEWSLPSLLHIWVMPNSIPPRSVAMAGWGWIGLQYEVPVM